MALPFYNWSLTAASNATADSTVNWAEGQAPSSVNDSARAMMASLAAHRDDTSGGTVGIGGSGSAYTATTNQVFDSLAHMNHQSLTGVALFTNSAGATLNVDGLGAKAIVTASGVPIGDGVMVANTIYSLTYFNSPGEWRLHGVYGNHSYIPLGGIIPYIGSSAPNAAFVFPYGQAINRTTYATLFALVSTTFGVGDGSTTFNVPDIRGRIMAGKDDMGGSAASRLTSTYFGTSAAALGAVGGGESSTLVTANLPAYTPAGTNSTSTAITNVNVWRQNNGVNNDGNMAAGATGTLTTVTSNVAAQTFTGTAQGGISTPVRTAQPTIITNYILRVL